MRKNIVCDPPTLVLLNQFQKRDGASHSATIRLSVQFYATAKGITVKPSKHKSK